MERLKNICLDWIDANVQRKHKNSLLFLMLSFYLTNKGVMSSIEFIGVGLTTLGIYIVGNLVSKNIKKDNKNGR